jgi:hypothetical protein
VQNVTKCEKLIYECSFLLLMNYLNWIRLLIQKQDMIMIRLSCNISNETTLPTGFYNFFWLCTGQKTHYHIISQRFIHALCDVITILQHDCSHFLQMWLIQRAMYAAVCALSKQLIPSIFQDWRKNNQFLQTLMYTSWRLASLSTRIKQQYDICFTCQDRTEEI